MSVTDLANKRLIDRLLLVVLLAMTIGGTLLPALVGVDDLVRYFAWHAILIELTLLAVPAHLFMRQRGGAKRFGMVSVSASEYIWAGLLGIGAFFVSIFLNGLMQLLFSALGAQNMDIATPLQFGGGWRFIAAIFLVAVVPAYAEESVFRGALLFSWLPQNRTRAMLHSAFLFALVHLNPPAMPSIFVLALLFCSLTVCSGSCYTSMVTHGVFNLVSLFAANLAASASADAALSLDSGMLLIGLCVYGAIGIPLCIFCYKAFRRAVSRRQALEQLVKPLPAPEQKAASEPTAAPAARSERHEIGVSRAAVIVTYVLMGLVNIVILVYMFADLTALQQYMGGAG